MDRVLWDSGKERLLNTERVPTSVGDKPTVVPGEENLVYVHEHLVFLLQFLYTEPGPQKVRTCLLNEYITPCYSIHYIKNAYGQYCREMEEQ